MLELNVRWTTELSGQLSARPVAMRDLTIIRQENAIRAFDEDGRQVWAREIASCPVGGEIAANNELIVTSQTLEVEGRDGTVMTQTHFDFFDEAAEHVGSASAEGGVQTRGLVVRGEAVHAWMNDGGPAFRRIYLGGEEPAVHEVLMPLAQPWDDNVTKRGVVLVGFTGRHEGALLWNPRNDVMERLVEDTDVWSHGIHEEIAVFVVGSSEADTAVIAIDLKTREEIWRRDDASRGIVVTEHGVLAYLGTTDRLPVLLDLHTGDILWKAEATHAGFTWDVAGPIAMARGRDTVMFDLQSGRRLGRARFSHVVALDDHFVVVDDAGLTAYDYPSAAPVRHSRPVSVPRRSRPSQPLRAVSRAQLANPARTA